ncbi:MAG: KOW motif domain-containing protein [Bdellovibrionales bacterium]|nr:KOW motif domain-containing protein [Bdellovibrionales bacterium]
MKKKLKVGDEVLVITGSDKGRQGVVLGFDPSQKKVRVKSVRMQTHFDKKEGIQKREGLIDRSNVKRIKEAPVKKPPTAKKKKKSS